MGRRMGKTKLASHSGGRIYINPKVPKTWRGIRMRARLLRHEKVERKLMRQGVPYRIAHKIALKHEHKGLTRKQIQRYEGKLGSIAREKR